MIIGFVQKRILDEEKVEDFVGDLTNILKIWQKGIKEMPRKLKLAENVFGESILRYSGILQKMKLKWILTKGILGLRSET